MIHAALLCLLLAGCVTVAPRDFALRIVSATGNTGSICSATAVGPHEIETAAHCLALPLRLVNDKPVTLVRFRKVSEDRIRATVAGVTFSQWAKEGVAHVGDRVRFWGQPLGRPFVYREGRVVAVYPDGLLIDVTVCPGDSGSGLFNDSGEMVGVVSFMSNGYGCTFMGAR